MNSHERREDMERSQTRFVYQTLKTGTTSYDERRELVRKSVENKEFDIEIFGSTEDANVIVVTAEDLERVRHQSAREKWEFIDSRTEVLDQTDMIYLINTTLVAQAEALPVINAVNDQFRRSLASSPIHTVVGNVLSSLQTRLTRSTRRHPPRSH